MKGGSEKGEQELKTRRQRKWERVETREGTNSENCRSRTALGAPCPAEGTALGLSLTPRQGRGRAPRAGTAPCPGLSTALCSAEPSPSRRQLTVLSAPHGESRSPFSLPDSPGTRSIPTHPAPSTAGRESPERSPVQNSSGEGIPAAPEPAGHAREGALPQTRLVPLCPPNLPALHSPLLSPSFNPSPASEHFVTVSPKQSLHGFATEQITLQMPTLTDAQKLDSLAKTTEGEKKKIS